jgi:hypothetical protein
MNTTLPEQFQSPINIKIVERGEIDTRSTQIHDRSHWWLDTGTSIKSGGVKFCVISGEATNTNCVVFGLTRSKLEPTIYRTRGENANQYATDAVW